MSGDDLDLLRHQLDWLDFQRLQGPLKPADEEQYKNLCRRERELLTREGAG